MLSDPYHLLLGSYHHKSRHQPIITCAIFWFDCYLLFAGA